ncbi:hypothetical protein [Catenuloplanes indicus]|uniref:Uncharacterized protein n=1 Tax=Catenuloplanes indicus TaxID=137267 RepID=A0AAE4B2G4_9ACTN|nr:hypothetical protein [Catenuloplanes indicus]MDQ0363352.1 hypothetical protein [Catenuloplanes indicus]MDQ0371674.1 hypothetical protein [Catenuloplanes indicus]
MSLTETQSRLYQDVIGAADGDDHRDVLAGMDASLDDKVAVAEELGGPGAGEAYRQEVGR